MFNTAPSNDTSGLPRSRSSSWLNGFAHVTAAIGCGLVLLAVGQPIWTDDVWWHLALGEAYLVQGPWLTHDPLLFTALAPPPPTSWLFDMGLRATWNTLGFAGLRILHIGLVAAILSLVWVSVRRASRSPAVASVCAALVAMLSAYRLVQLRPHLGTILAALLLHWILFSKPEIPSWRRSLVAVVLMGVWANLHPAYPIGPSLVAAASAGLFLFSFLKTHGGGFDVDLDRGFECRARATRFAWVALAGLGATLLNPLGADGYVRAFSAGMGSESVAIVADEWSRIHLWSWPTASLPPSLLNWTVAWLLVATVPFTAARVGWARWGHDGTSRISMDPLIVVLAVVGLIAMCLATRFAWMAFWPVLLLASAMRGRMRTRWASRWTLLALVAFVVMSLPGFYLWGDWPMISRGLPSSPAGFRMPYAAGKYHAHAVSFMRETKLEGNLFGRYAEGGFQSFWLGPAIRTAMNGSLNMSEEALAAYFAIRERIGTPANPRFEEALDELGIDLFLGTGLPVEVRPGRPPNYSTIYLEGTPGWVLVFRNLDSALYLRNNERNAVNLTRIAEYYLDEGIPFDRTLGFPTGRVLREAPDWSRAHGLWTPMLGARSAPGRTARRLGPMAMAYLALGMYDEAKTINDASLRIDPSDPSALRTRAWLLLRPGRRSDGKERSRRSRELVTVFRALSRSSSSTGDSTQQLLALLSRAIAGEAIPPRRSQVVPVFTRQAARRLLRSMNPAGPFRD